MTQSKPTKPKTGELPISGRQGQEATGRKSGADEEIAALKSQFDNAGPVRVRKLTNNQALADFFTIPEDMERSIADMVKDLSEVPVVDAYCSMTNPFRKIDCSPNISPTDRQLIWKCLAVVREAFKRADGCAEDGLQRGYQWNMNWKHTRAEIDQVLEASKLLRLDPQSTAEAILASIFSDSVKNRRNFIVHNIDGAYGAAQVLCKFLNPSNARDLKRIERVARAVREHQVAPPSLWLARPQ